LPSQGDPGEREPRLARRSPFVLSTKLCPKCLAPLSSANELGGWLVPMNYYCSKCGYSGTVYLEKEPGPSPGPD
jgi:hypothetical protein